MPSLEPERVLAAIEAIQQRHLEQRQLDRRSGSTLLEGVLEELLALGEAGLGLLVTVEGESPRVEAAAASEQPGASEVSEWLCDRFTRGLPRPLQAALIGEGPRTLGYDPRMPTLDNVLVLPGRARARRRAVLLLGNREGGFDPGLIASLAGPWVAAQLVVAAIEEAQRVAALTAEVERERANLRTFLDAPGAVAYVIDEHRRVQWANRGFAALVDGAPPPEQLIGELEDELISPTTAARTRDLDAQVLATDAPVRVDEPVLTGEGELRWWRGAKFPLAAPEGQRWIGALAFDVTEQVSTGEQLREREAELATAREFARLGRWSWDVHSDRVAWDLAYARLAGLGTAGGHDLAGLLARVHPDDVAACEARLRESVRSGASRVELEHRMLVGGEVRELAVMALIRRTNEGPQVIGLARDVSEQRRGERQRRDLEARARAVERAIVIGAMIGREFDELLVGILGNAGIALDEIESAGQVRGGESLAGVCVQDIEFAAERAARLNRQMLALTTRGRTSRIAPVDLSSLVASVAEPIQARIGRESGLAAPSPALAVRLVLHPELPSIEGDAVMLRRMVLDLADNGIEAIGDRPGELTLATGIGEQTRDDLAEVVEGGGMQPGRYVWLEVRDTGSGMEENVQARMFEPFHSTKSNVRGLGLAAVLATARSHGGGLRVYSAPGEGTRVRVLLPLPARASGSVAIE
ncbi:ATP-binding protein [Nannocystaceae bacterium ST9]